MAPVTPTGEPSEFVAGDSVRWRIPDHADYPTSESWSLRYELVGVNTLAITPTFQTSGDDQDHWLVDIATTATDDLDAGRYELVKRFVGSGTFAGREETVARFVLSVRENPRSAVDGAFQTHAERTLAVINAALEGRLTKDLESYQIAGRSISKIPIRDLHMLRSRYAAAVRQERTGKIGRKVEVEFVKVGV